MVIHEIVTNPKLLKQICEPVDKLIDNPILDEICIGLIETYHKNIKICSGLAANQIGFNQRVILVKLLHSFVIMINPVISPSHMHGRITYKESCLSFPGKVTRVGATRITGHTRIRFGRYWSH